MRKKELRRWSSNYGSRASICWMCIPASVHYSRKRVIKIKTYIGGATTLTGSEIRCHP